MKKLIIIMVVILFGTQAPTKAVWIGHKDVDEQNNCIEGPEDETHYAVRKISVYFTMSTPSETELTFARKNKQHAEDEIKKLFDDNASYKEIGFNQVSKPSHMEFIKAVLEHFNLGCGTPTVNFADSAEESLMTEWKDFFQEMKNAHNKAEEAKFWKKEIKARKKGGDIGTARAWEQKYGLGGSSSDDDY